MDETSLGIMTIDWACAKAEPHAGKPGSSWTDSELKSLKPSFRIEDNHYLVGFSEEMYERFLL